MNRFLPRASAPLLDANRVATTEFRRFLESLAAETDNAGLQQQINAIIARLDALDPDDPNTVFGIMSVTSSGDLRSGDVAVSLQNDQDTPPAGYYYGTNALGSKGWHALPDASGGVLPVVTGEVPPVFVYFDDGSLLYAPVP